MVPTPSGSPIRYYKTAFFAIVATLPLAETVRKRLEDLTGNVSWNPKYLTLLLGAASQYGTGPSEISSLQDRCRLVRFLLQLGADPNHRQHALGPLKALNDPCSAFTRALETILNLQEDASVLETYPTDGPSSRRASEEILKTLEAFSKSGAKLDTPALMTLIMDKDHRPQHLSDQSFHGIAVESPFKPNYRFVILETTASLLVDCIKRRLHPDIIQNLEILQREPLRELGSPRYAPSMSPFVKGSPSKASSSLPPVRIISIGHIRRSVCYLLQSEEDSDYLLDLVFPWLTNELPFYKEGSESRVRYPEWNQAWSERSKEVVRRSDLIDITHRGVLKHLHDLGYRVLPRSRDFEDIPQFLE